MSVSKPAKKGLTWSNSNLIFTIFNYHSYGLVTEINASLQFFKIRILNQDIDWVSISYYEVELVPVKEIGAFSIAPKQVVF